MVESYANGTVTIAHPDKNVVEDFITYFLLHWSWDSSRQQNCVLVLGDEFFEEREPETNMHTQTVTFFSEGKEVFIDTLSHMKKHMQQYLTPEKYNHFLNLPQPLECSWSFRDIEPYEPRLYEAITTFTIGKGEIQQKESHLQKYEYTKENTESLDFPDYINTQYELHLTVHTQTSVIVDPYMVDFFYDRDEAYAVAEKFRERKEALWRKHPQGLSLEELKENCKEPFAVYVDIYENTIDTTTDRVIEYGDDPDTITVYISEGFQETPHIRKPNL